MPWIELLANQGLQEKASGKLGGRFDVVKNLSQLANGEYLAKRQGHTTIASTSQTYHLRMDQYNAVRAPMWLSRVRSYDAIGTTGGQVFAADPDDSNHKFYYAGSFGTCKPVRIAGTISGYNISDASGPDYSLGTAAPTCAIMSTTGATCACVPTSTTKILAQIADKAGVVVSRGWFDTGTNDTGVRARVVAVGSQFWLLVQDQTDIRLYAAGIDYRWWNFGVLVSLAGFAGYWDVTTNGSYVWVVYQSSTTKLTVARFNYSGGIVTGPTYDITVGDSGTIGLSAATITWIADCPTDTLWVGWRNGDESTGLDIYYTVLNEDCTDATGGAGPFDLGLTAANARKAEPPVFGRAEYMGFEDFSPATTPAALVLMYRRDPPTESYYTSAFLATTASFTAAGDWRHFYYVRVIAKPDNHNRFWCIGTAGGTQLGELFRPMLARAAVRWYDLSDTVIDVQLSVELTGRLSQYGSLTLDTDYQWIGTVGSDSERAMVPVPVVRQGTDLAYEVQIQVLEYALPEHDPRAHTVQMWDQLLVAGAPTIVGANPFSTEYDGVTTDAVVPPMLMGSSEFAFNAQPVIVATTSNAAGGSMTAGTYKYVALYQFVDAQGRRHRSAPSPEVEVTITTDTRIVLTITAPICTVRGESLSHYRPTTLIYRTEDGQDVFKFAGSDNCLAANENAIFTDDNPDSVIADEETVYTDGGVLAFDTAPSCRWITVSEERVWCGGLFQREIVQCSNKLIPTEGASFPDDNAFRVILPDDNEGLASMDGRTILFTRTGVYLVTGGGPDRQGVGSFGALQTLSTGIGCINGYSVLSTPVGVIYQARDGYYLLPRGFGTIVPIGDSVRDTVRSGDGQYCWGATLVTTSEGIEARWLVSSSASVDPYTLLVLNIRTMQWSVDVIAPLVSPRVDTFGAIGSWQKGCVLAHTDLNNAYPIRHQMYDDPQPTDNGGTATTDYVQSELRTSWQHPFGVGMWGRVDKVLVNLDGSDYTATVQVETTGYNLSKATYSASFNFASSGDPYNQVVLDGIRGQQCSAVRVTVSDAKLSAVNSTFGVVSIWLHVSPADREIPLPSTRRG